MIQSTRLASFICAFVAVTHALPAEDVLEPSEPLTSFKRNEAMPELGDTSIEKILKQYYTNGLGGTGSWDEVESFHLEGTLSLAEVDLALVAFQKKPNLLKMSILHPESEIPLQMGYDGDIAWEQMPGQEARSMGAEETRRFAHNAYFGSHLLFPFREGKTVRYIDTVPVDGEICHQIRVTNAEGYQIDYFIDIRTFLETKVRSVDTTTGFVSTLIYKDYSREFGLPIAQTIESYENGELISTFTIDQIKLNTGLMPWMFHKPTED